jgi:hypothetical protein
LVILKNRTRANLAALIFAIAAAAVLAIWPLLWTVREGVPPLSANSEFFAYSWIYGIRWGAGETVFMPHSQLLFPIYALINHLFGMTTGNAADIIAGWHRIALIWPIVLMVVSLVLIFSTVDREKPVLDSIFSAVIFVCAIPLFLSEYALASLSYHSIAIPLALASLPLWRHYRSADTQPSMNFYIAIGIYTAICALGKPTFIAFAAPFFAMEFLRSVQARNFSGPLLAGLVAVAAYLVALLLFYGNIEGVRYHFSESYEFMRSQANWYDAEKGATPLHWFFGYVIWKMGPLPSILMAISLIASFARRDRLMILVGAIAAIAGALFVLYQRSQVHAHAEFVALLATTAISSIRCSGVLNLRFQAATAATILLTCALLVHTVMHLPDQAERGFTRFMGLHDKLVVHAIFEPSSGVRTIVLEDYPHVFWGVVDAWCRGSGNIFDATRSTLLDKAFGNVACLVNHDSPTVDITSYTKAVFILESKTPLLDVISRISKAFPGVGRHFEACDPVGPEQSGLQLVACQLTSGAADRLR